uniref:Acetyltransf_18 domain-containing protein n=1 Tax=Rhabditophanes sp. KR3021 TaxID=114890 RepID=A0AC35U8G0_9BILA
MSVPVVLPGYNSSLIPETTSAKVQKNGTIVAAVSITKLSKAQGYCVVHFLDKNLRNKIVTLKEDVAIEAGSDNTLELGEVVSSPVDKRLLRVYIQVHHLLPEQYLIEHLVNQLSEAVLGSLNLELTKNVTIDFYDTGADKVFRDAAGFIVGERFCMHAITVDSAKAEKVLKACQGVTVTKTTEKDLEKIISYDNTLSGFKREDFVEYLSRNSSILLATQDNEVVGYISGKGPEIYGVYGESEEIGDHLLLEYINKLSPPSITLKSKYGYWKNLLSVATKTRSICRRHTRHCPKLKWDKIFAANVGMNLY